MIERPQYIEKIKPFIDKDVVKVLTGIRRSGKSTLFKLLQAHLKDRGVSEKAIFEINFESMKWSGTISTYVNLYDSLSSFCEECEIKGMRPYIFVDEIQTIENWEKAINSLRVDFDCDIYVSGSNSKLLSGELSTLLAGRYVSFNIFPFSFNELRLAMCDLDKEKVYAQYSIYGGFPFLSHIKYDPESLISYLIDVFNSVALNDIVARNNFRNAEQLTRILTYFMSEIGTTFSVDNLVKTIIDSGQTISSDTVYKYLYAAENAMLLYRVKRFDIKGKELLRGSEKAYVADIGLRQALLGNNDKRVDLVLENIVFLELIRRGFDVHIGKIGEKEIDFVAEMGDERIYIQVAYSMENESTRTREFGALLDIRDSYPKFIVTHDLVNWSSDGIKCINIRDFLAKDWF